MERGGRERVGKRSHGRDRGKNEAREKCKILRKGGEKDEKLKRN